MTASTHPIDPDTPLARVEDHRLLTGRGRYVHDVNLPGQLFAAFARSVYARARIVAVHTDGAQAIAGVVAVVTGQDVAGLTLPPPNALLPDLQAEPVALMPGDAIRSVGQPLALVLARTPEAARQGAEAVWVEAEPEDARNDHAPDAARVARVRHHTADRPAGVAHVVRVAQSQPRVAAMALEPRAAVMRWDGEHRQLEAWLPTQTPSRARADIARLLGLAPAQVRVIAPDVGGAFGAKSSLGPEELLLAWAAREHRCALKWTASRSEEFTAGVHGRGGHLSGELALDAEGRFLHLSAALRFPVGAWLPYSAVVPARNAARILPGPYRVAGVDIEAVVEASDAAAVTIYRGAGRPEATLLMERLVERAARQIGMDPLALRRHNLVAADQMPWATPTGETLDAGDYRAVLERAAEGFNYTHERAEQARRRAAGEWVGIGTALYVEPCGQGWESARVTLRADGRVEVASGSSAQGQGHETSYATIAAQALGLEPRQVRVRHGDTARCPEGVGALASRSMAIGGSAVWLAAREVAQRRDAGEALPLSAEQVYTAPAEAWSYGCVMARLSLDGETGQPRVERLVWADDAGHIVSPQLAHGQLIGGLAQGLGQALLERLVYDSDGQLVTGSLMDYAVPRADDMPPVEIHSVHVPTTANALGAKGVGEAGCIGVPAALLNAAADALAPLGEPDLDFPLTAERLWRVISNPHPSSTP